MNSITCRKQIIVAMSASIFCSGFAVAQSTLHGEAARQAEQNTLAQVATSERSDKERADTSSGSSKIHQSEGSSKANGEHRDRSERHEAAAQKHVNDAVQVVVHMEGTPDMAELLQQARGVFIVPTYGRAAIGVGGEGGSGVLLAKLEYGSWSDPVFYNIAGLDVGLQAGGETGPMALILNNQKAVDRFMKTDNFSLKADTGITVVDWAKRGERTGGAGDVIVWSQEKGLFGNVASVGVEDIKFNRNLTRAYYERNVTPKEIITAQGTSPQAEPLRQALAHAAPSSSATGSSTSGLGKSSKMPSVGGNPEKTMGSSTGASSEMRPDKDSPSKDKR